MTEKLSAIGWIKPGAISGSAVYRVENAYPILETGYEQKVKRINEYLANFSNLQPVGKERQICIFLDP